MEYVKRSNEEMNEEGQFNMAIDDCLAQNGLKRIK